MPAYGIEKISEDQYKVILFQYRWQCNKWIEQKPNKRRLAQQTALDTYLKNKARTTTSNTIRDTRRKDK